MNTFVAGDDVQWLLSTEMKNGIPRYSLRINNDLFYEAFHLGIPCTIKTLSRNRIYKLDAWSKIDEVLRFLHEKENSHHEDVLLEQMDNMRPIALIGWYNGGNGPSLTQSVTNVGPPRTSFLPLHLKDMV